LEKQALRQGFLSIEDAILEMEKARYSILLIRYTMIISITLTEFFLFFPDSGFLQGLF
jgi:hypothetical protein